MKPSYFIFMSVALAAGSLTGTAFATTSSIYFNNKCVDLPNADTTNGNRLQLWDCNGTEAQQWTFMSDGTVRSNVNTNKCIDLPGWNTADGTPIQIYDCNGGSNQQWTAINNTIQGFGGECIDDPGAVTTDGTKLQYWSCNGWVNQDFSVAPAVYGDILNRWLSLGGATGSLGLPTSDEVPFKNGVIQYFTNGGAIAWLDGDNVVSANGNEIILQAWVGADYMWSAQQMTMTISSNGWASWSGDIETSVLIGECDTVTLGFYDANGVDVAGGSHNGCTCSVFCSHDTWGPGWLYSSEVANDWNNIYNGWSYSWSIKTSPDL
jgi:uncharacterized protein with LGFP repeats